MCLPTACIGRLNKTQAYKPQKYTITKDHNNSTRFLTLTVKECEKCLTAVDTKNRKLEPLQFLTFRKTIVVVGLNFSSFYVYFIYSFLLRTLPAPRFDINMILFVQYNNTNIH